MDLGGENMWKGVRRWGLAMSLMACNLPAQQPVATSPSTSVRSDEVLVVLGAPGEPQYQTRFQQAADAWKAACAAASVHFELIGADPAAPEKDAERLQTRLKAAAGSQNGGALWLVLIGHGTFDGREAKFNLRGPDVSAATLAAWLKPIGREMVIVDCASSSGGFMKPLSGPRRVVVTATKSADEVFYARFGEYFAAAIGGLEEADEDRDDEVSVLEAFLYASRTAQSWYVTEGRLATEHALIDDNGDGIGTRAEVFEGVRAVVGGAQGDAPKPDGDMAHRFVLVLNAEDATLSETDRKRRDELEAQVRGLVDRKASMNEDDYYRELEKLLLEVARLYQKPARD